MSLTQAVESPSPSMAVINKVAATEGVEPTELEPLFEAIDPDALDALVESTEQNGSEFTVELTYHGYEVTVTGDREVHLDEAA